MVIGAETMKYAATKPHMVSTSGNLRIMGIGGDIGDTSIKSDRPTIV